MAQEHSWITGSIKDNDFIFKNMSKKKELELILENISKVVLAFYREGSIRTQENLPGHRLLDDVTGILFVFGFFLGLRHWKKRKYFYGIAGVVALSLPAFLSEVPLHTSRMIGIAPFIAYLAGLAGLEIWNHAKPSPPIRKWVVVVGACAAFVCIFENFHVYFVERPQNESCWMEAGVAPMKVGQAIANLSNHYEYYLSSTFFRQFTVLFLGYDQKNHMHSLELPQSFCPLSPAPGKGLFFALQEGGTGVLGILQKIYPQGTTEKLLDPWNRPFLYFFKVSPEFCGVNRGLSQSSIRPAFGNDNILFPEGLPKAPFVLHLTGSMWVEKSGFYFYRLSGKTRVTGECPWNWPRPRYLVRGFHPVDFTLRSPSGSGQFGIEESFSNGPFQPLDSTRFIPYRFSNAWKGTYLFSDSAGFRHTFTQTDPVLNFSYRDDFPIKNTTDLQVEWKSILHPSEIGLYHFLMLTTDHTKTEMEINGKKVAVSNQEIGLFLEKKDYRVVIRLRQEGGFENAFHLTWEPPGTNHYEVLPPEALK
jgi:hypothetical protein